MATQQYAGQLNYDYDVDDLDCEFCGEWERCTCFDDDDLDEDDFYEDEDLY